MFIISLTYTRDINDVDKYIDAHMKYIDKYYALNKFLVSGRKVPRTGGVILANCESLDEVNKIVQEDPFYEAGVAKFDVTEFVPSRTASGYEVLTDL